MSDTHWAELGDQFKAIEAKYALFLPPKNIFVTRLDGRAFHTYTRGLQRPYDAGLSDDLDTATRTLLGEVGGAIGAYCQSDEISVFYSDTAQPGSQIWFGGKVNKINSVAASIFSTAFLAARFKRDWERAKIAAFDARTHPIESMEDYLAWRSEDCTKNAINMIADAHFSHKQLDGVSTRHRREMLERIGVDINSYPAAFLFGRTFQKVSFMATTNFQHKKTGEWNSVEHESYRWEVSAVDHRSAARRKAEKEGKE